MYVIITLYVIITWIFTDIPTIPCPKLHSHYFPKLFPLPAFTILVKGISKHPVSCRNLRVILSTPFSLTPFTLPSKYIHSLLLPSTTMALVHIFTSLLEDCVSLLLYLVQSILQRADSQHLKNTNCQRVQTSSYKMNKFWGSNIKCGNYH